MHDIVVQEIKAQLVMDENLLLQMLAAQHGLGATPGTIRDAKTLFLNAKRKLAEKICSDKKIQSIYKSSSNSKVVLAAALVDCISGATSGISPITVSVLMVKEGLSTLCIGFWPNEE